jgi:hypothetical protein
MSVAIEASRLERGAASILGVECEIECDDSRTILIDGEARVKIKTPRGSSADVILKADGTYRSVELANTTGRFVVSGSRLKRRLCEILRDAV